jgi:hypothetical protein
VRLWAPLDGAHVIADALMDWLFALPTWMIGLLPDATFDPSVYGDPAQTLNGIASQGQGIVSGGIGVIFNGQLLAAMVAGWLVIEGGTYAVRTIVWIKKAVLF